MRLTRCLALLLALAVPASAQARDLVIFAAASLKEPLDALAAAAGNTVVSYGGSGALARQVAAGAPADIVLLANTEWMDTLAAAGAIDPATRADFLSNTLVLVSGAPAPVALTPAGLAAALGAEGRLAIGQTASVPAGQYGKAALTTLGLWDGVQHRLAEVDNVRAALVLADRGEVPLALVYGSDARAAPRLHIVATFPPDTYPEIRYTAARVAASDHPAAAAMLALLRSADGQGVFAAAGFLPLPPE